MCCCEALKELHLVSCFLKRSTSSERFDSGKLNQQETLLREKASCLFLDFLIFNVFISETQIS